MAIQTYGVTATEIGHELLGLDLSGLSSQMSEWLTRAGAKAERLLRARGWESSAVAGYGATDSLYQLCRAFVTHSVCADVLAAGTQDVPRLLEHHAGRAGELERELQQVPEATTAEWDPDEQSGAARTNRLHRAAVPGEYVPAGVFRIGMRF